MSRIIWDASGERYFETGVSKGVLYPMTAGTYDAGVAWNGLTGITESPSGAEPTDLWADNIKYASMRSAEDFGATVEAYTYPDEFAACDGSLETSDGVFIGQQTRKTFGLSYQTKVSNDTDREAYKIHLIYNATAAPSERAYATVNDSPDAITMSWELSTTPVNIAGHKPAAHIIIDSRKADSTKLLALETILYGKDAVVASEGVEAQDAIDPRLPLPVEIISLMA